MKRQSSLVSPGNNSAEVAAYAAARNICRRHSSELFFASALLPIAKRNGLYAVHAFTRMMRDVFKSSASSKAKVSTPATLGTSSCSTNSIDETMSMFRGRLDDLHAGRLELPRLEYRSESQHVLHALSVTIDRYQIPKGHFLELAEGCRMDLSVSRYATWAALEKYCDRSGGAAGLIVSCVLGLSHSDAGKHAVQLGNAMRFTHILRDVREDLERGRLYLPLEDLARFKVTQHDLAAGVATTHFRELMRFEIARARELYREGAKGLCWLEGDGSRMFASLVAMMQSGILGAIERRGYDIFTHRADLSTARKLRQLAPAWRLARRRVEEPSPAVFG